MTMLITVTNNDQSRTLRVQRRSIKLDRTKFVPTGDPPTDDGNAEFVAPGASAQVWLHQGLDCVLSEYQAGVKV